MSALCALAVSAAFTSCDEDDDDDWDDDDRENVGGNVSNNPSSRVYFLCEGSWSANNSTLDVYNPVAASYSGKIYAAQNNGEGLGDTAQDIVEEDGYLYIIVSGSNRLVKTNASGLKLGTVSFSDEEGQPRNLVEEDGKLYVTLYSGNVMKIDAVTLAKEGMVQVGMNPEQIVEEGGKLYVANSGWGAGNTMSVIDIATFAVEKTVTVAQNPDRMLESEDKIFIQSYGGAYPDYTYPVEMYDPVTGSLTTVGHATRFAEYDGVVYMAYGDTDWATYESTTTFSYYNVKTGELKNEDFLQAVPDEIRHGSIYMLNIDPENGDFYLSVSDYTTNGTIYRFNHAGELVDTQEASGVNPNKALFVD